MVNPKLRTQVAERANYRCEYCQSLKSYAPSPFNLEHIVPLSLGGSTDFQNLAFACFGCNLKKSDKLLFPDPLNGNLVPIFNPRKQNWTNHFIWSKDKLLVIGITSIGRASISGLELNRTELLNLRSVLKLVLLHPP